jgi:tRNA pseudouridine55 synthase
MSGPGPEGLAVVDKPAGMTSHDVVARARRQYGTRKVGHAGTLDPDATGVLLLGVGRVTRLLRFLSALGKSYVGEVVLGVETSTLDAAGAVTARHDMAGTTPAQVAAAAVGFVGATLQRPPMVSALKVGGRRLHELAREGVEVERAPRPVTVRRFDVVPTADPLVYGIAVDCSSGTYVRSLADDLGRTLGGGAHLRSLRRVAVGSFTEEEARPLEEAPLLAPVDALRDLPVVDLGPEAAATLARSGRLVLEAPAPGLGPWRVIDPAGRLVAVAERRPTGEVRPAVVLVEPAAG